MPRAEVEKRCVMVTNLSADFDAAIEVAAADDMSCLPTPPSSPRPLEKTEDVQASARHEEVIEDAEQAARAEKSPAVREVAAAGQTAGDTDLNTTATAGTSQSVASSLLGSEAGLPPPAPWSVENSAPYQRWVLGYPVATRAGTEHTIGSLFTGWDASVQASRDASCQVLTSVPGLRAQNAKSTFHRQTKRSKDPRKAATLARLAHGEWLWLATMVSQPGGQLL